MSIEIEQGSWKRIAAPSYSEDIRSGGMGPCVSVFIYNVESKVTYACHYTSPDIHELDDFKEMIDSALYDFRNSKEIKIFVSGAILSEKDSLVKRGFVENILRRNFTKNTDFIFKWPGTDVDMVEVVFEPETGTLHEPE